VSILQRHATSGMTSLFQALESNARTRIYVVVAAAGIVATIVLWVLHLSFPYVFMGLIERDSKLLFWGLFAVVVAPPFAVAFSIGTLIFRRTNEPVVAESGPMSGYFYRERANREWKIAIVAGIFGGLNFLLTLITGEPL
jgi:hypothetical protein